MYLLVSKFKLVFNPTHFQEIYAYTDLLRAMKYCSFVSIVFIPAITAIGCAFKF